MCQKPQKYIGYFEEAFLIEKAVRYDIKGRKYMALRAYLWVKSVAEMPVKPLHC